MKILTLHLTAFGPFNGTAIDFSHGNDGLHIIYGPNEAGKSSALRALRAAFYGIDVRSPDNFQHPYNKMRIKATIRHSDGRQLTFIRRKGSKNTLRADNDEKILTDSILSQYLNHIDADLFSTMFGIGHQDLVEGGREIIKGGGNLGQIIFAAGSGISNLRTVQTQLQENADTLFKPTGKIPLINQSVFQVRENRKLIKNVQLNAGDWEKHDKALAQALEKKKSAEQALARAMAEKNRLKRIQQSLPVITERSKILEDLKHYASVVLLPESFGELRRDHMSKLKIAQNEHCQAEKNIAQLNEEISRLDVSNPILQSADEIERFYQELGGFVKAARDRSSLQTRMDILRSEARQILSDLRNDMTIDEAEQLRLTKKETLYIQELGSRYERIVTLIDNTREQIPKLEHQIKESDQRLKALPVPRNTAELLPAIDNAADYTAMETQCAEALAESNLAEKSLEIELRRLPFWSGTLETLAGLSTPSVETIDRFKNEFDAVNGLMQKNEDEIQKLKTDLSAAIKKIEELNLNFSVPTETELLQARKKRDILWQMIADGIAASGKTPDNSQKSVAPFSEQFPEEDSLATAFEATMLYADQISDRLRREADRVATLAKLVSDRSDIEKRLNHVKDVKKAHDLKYTEIASTWAAQWSDAKISPGSPKEMQAWTSRKNDMTARYAESRKQIFRAELKRKKIEKIRQTLLQAFASLNEVVPDNDALLADLVRRGKKLAENEKDLLHTREKIIAEKSQKNALLADLKIRARTSEKELAVWQQQWEKAVSPIGLDADSVPSHASAFLEDLKHLFDKLKDADILQKRINGIDRDAAAFGAGIQKLTANAAPDLSDLPPDQGAAEMIARLKETRTACSKAQTLENQLEKESQRLGQSSKAIADMEAFLKTMCEEAGCSNYSDLADAENRSDQRRKLEAELKSAEMELVKMSAGHAIEDFISECLAKDPDTIGSEIENLCDDIDDLSKEKSDLDQTIGSQRTELAKMDGSARAAELSEDTQIILGGLEEQVEAYVRYKLAGAVLNRTIERFREKNQSPMLQKAGLFFSQITGGSFDSIRAEFDDSGNPVIAGIRDSAREIVTVDGMSDGTADQLYLCLRLAGLEEYLAKNEPMPFIIDDILIKFDDTRARATLKVLADLSSKTQIIFFTHHRHLLELAQKHIDSSVLFSHNL